MNKNEYGEIMPISTLTLHDIQEKKKALDKDIEKRVMEFVEETGLYPDAIKVVRVVNSVWTQTIFTIQ